jgi:hypothetical protein
MYADATSHQLDQVAVNFFCLTWILADIAARTNVTASPQRRHGQGLRRLTQCARLEISGRRASNSRLELARARGNESVAAI